MVGATVVRAFALFTERLEAPPQYYAEPWSSVVLRDAVQDHGADLAVRPACEGSSHRQNGCNRPQLRSAGEKRSEYLPAARRSGLELPSEMGFPRELRNYHVRSANEHTEQQLRRI